jgi:CRISPR-associated exonuclease Cas4
MLGQPVPRGAIFYGEPRRRLEVEFSLQLRARTETLAAEMHRLYQYRETPPANPGNHCRNCSLLNVCLPHATAQSTIQTRWNRLQRQALQLSA